MRDRTGDKPGRKPPSLGETLFLSGACFAVGIFPLLIGLGIISGNVEVGPGGRLLAVVAGLVFISGGVMIFLRDMAGVQNREEIPANAPRWIRIGESVIGIATLAGFAALCSILAFGPFFAPDLLPDMTRQMGRAGAAIFRIANGAFAIILWYGAIYLILDRIKKANAGSP